MARKLHRYRPPNDLDTPLPASPHGSRPIIDPLQSSLTSLPSEIQLLIASYLIYPDALSLKHTSRYFYDLVYTGVNLKIEWLIERRQLHLDCPVDIGKGCELGSDTKFCRGSVGLLMKRRREHGECDVQPGGRGCLVFGTGICTDRKIERRKWVLALQWTKAFVLRTSMVTWILIPVMSLTIAWLWLCLLENQSEAIGQ